MQNNVHCHLMMQCNIFKAFDPLLGFTDNEGFWVACRRKDSYLIDPTNSHMIVSKIKPSMCKYKLFCNVKLQMVHYISSSFFDGILLESQP